MKETDFLNEVILQGKIHSCMTNRLSKRKAKKFRSWFVKQGKKRFKWSRPKAILEWNAYINAFKIQINDGDRKNTNS